MAPSAPIAGEERMPAVANFHLSAPGLALVSNGLLPVCARSCPSTSQDEPTAPGAGGRVAVRQAEISVAPTAAATNIVTIRILATDSLIRWAARQDSASGLRLSIT